MATRTLIVTVPGMIAETDYAPLAQLSEVTYHEAAQISESELDALCAGYDYLMLNYDVVEHLSADFYGLPHIKALRAISVDITGVDWASPESAEAHSIPLLNIPHYSTESVAESTLAEVLLHSRQRHLAYIDELRGRPIEARFGFNLVGRTAGVIGLGSIGTRVAELLSAVGMDVIAWNRSERESPFSQVSLPELFSKSKVICVCLKTVRTEPSNVGIVSRELLSLPEGAVVINLANVDLVDNEAMADAIEAGRVVGYTVERKDYLLESRLGALDAVHMPPSNAWASEESLTTLRHVWVKNVLDAINGDFPNVVHVPA